MEEVLLVTSSSSSSMPAIEINYRWSPLEGRRKQTRNRAIQEHLPLGHMKGQVRSYHQQGSYIIL